MEKLNIKKVDDCRWDGLAMGEIMLRLDPGEGRLKTTRSFQVWEGGGEYNVIRGLKRCFGQRTAVVTGIPESEIGYLLQDFIYQGGVDSSHVKWFPYDGMGRQHRQGLNFVERGYGVRGAKGISDRAYTAVSSLKPGDIDWKKIFHDEGVRWFHTGGIFAALSESTAALTIEAMKAAKETGTIVSYDLNYRPSLWASRGGQEAAHKVNQAIAPYVDVMIGNEEDFTAALGFKVEGLEKNIQNLNTDKYKTMMSQVVEAYPNFKAVATTLRDVHSAIINDWSALLYYGNQFYQSKEWKKLEIMDRVGGGDSFASGLIYGFLSGKDPMSCINYGAAHGALAMTTPGDTSMASLVEVKKLAEGGSARVER